MFWLAEKDFSRIVPLTWRRDASPGELSSGLGSANKAELPVSVEEDVAHRMATWSQKGHAHYLAFDDADAPGEGSTAVDGASSADRSRSRTVLRIEPEKVSLTRFGEVRWNHTFEVGRVGNSTLSMGGFEIDVEAKPNRLDVEVGPDGGAVLIDYHMTLASTVQHVELTLRFGEEVSVGERDEG